MSILTKLTALFRPKRRAVKASYDAYTSRRHQRHFASANLSSTITAAHTRSIRCDLMAKARYEMVNNPLLNHLLQLHICYVLGSGVRLNLSTQSPNFNAMVEEVWERWINNRKLYLLLRWAIASRIIDGEVFLQLTEGQPTDDDLPVTLDIIQLPPENVTHLPTSWGEIDGLKLDAQSRVVGYYVIPYSPELQPVVYQKPQLINKDSILHWYRCFRQNQYRGVTELAPVLDLCAQMRRYIDATIDSAELAAKFSVLLKTTLDPAYGGGEDAVPLPLSELEVKPGTMLVLPHGYDMAQLRSEHPPNTFQSVIEYMIAEIGRCIFGMPYNLAAADSRQANFSSARIDHLLYQRRVAAERREMELSLLNPLLTAWFAETARARGWSGPYDRPPRHQWIWPSFPAIQPEIAAEAAKTELALGLTHRRALLAERGLDIEDEDEIAAADLGVSVEEYRRMCYAQAKGEKIAVTEPEDLNTDQ